MSRSANKRAGLRFTAKVLAVLVKVVIWVLVLSTPLLGMWIGSSLATYRGRALWLPIVPLVDMLLIMAVAGGVITVMALIAHKIRKSKDKIEVPYGVAIAFGGLWVFAQPYLNHFA